MGPHCICIGLIDTGQHSSTACIKSCVDTYVHIDALIQQIQGDKQQGVFVPQTKCVRCHLAPSAGSELSQAALIGLRFGVAGASFPLIPSIHGSLPDPLNNTGNAVSVFFSKDSSPVSIPRKHCMKHQDRWEWLYAEHVRHAASTRHLCR